MRPIAENHTSVTKKLFHEGMDAVTNPKYKLILRITAAVVVILFAAFGIYNVIRGGSPLMLAGELLFIVVLCAWILYFMPRSNRNTKYKLMSQQAGGEPQRSITFFEDHFVVYAEGGKSITVPYSGITEIRETPHLYIVMRNSGPSVMISKEGFTTGDMNTVKSAVEKTPKAKKQTLAEIANKSYDTDQ